MTFFTDEGGTYEVWQVGEVAYAKGLRTNTTYQSTKTAVVVNGKVRRQKAYRDTSHGFYVTGSRAVLHLDTGEAWVSVPGVATGTL